MTLDSARNRKWTKNDGAVGCNGSDWRQIAAATAQYCRVDDGGTFGGVGDQAAWLFGCFRRADVMVMANFARRSLAREEKGLSLASKY